MKDWNTSVRTASLPKSAGAAIRVVRKNNAERASDGKTALRKSARSR